MEFRQAKGTCIVVTCRFSTLSVRIYNEKPPIHIAQE